MVATNTRNKGVEKMGFRQMLEIRDLRQENEQLKARISELEAVLEQHNIHILDKNCWCRPEVENEGGLLRDGVRMESK